MRKGATMPPLAASTWMSSGAARDLDACTRSAEAAGAPRRRATTAAPRVQGACGAQHGRTKTKSARTAGLAQRRHVVVVPLQCTRAATATTTAGSAWQGHAQHL